MDDLESVILSETAGLRKKSGAAAPIPVPRVRDRLDELTAKKDYDGAARLLAYWRGEAKAAGDLRGEFFVLNEMMGVYRKMEDPEKALQSADEALALIPALDYGDTVAAATAYVNAGTVCDFCGDPERAAGYFDAACAIYERELDPNDGRLGGLYNNMALALSELGRSGEAFHCYRRALDIMGRQPFGALEQAITYLNMANAAEAAKGMEAAEEEIEGYLRTAETLLAEPALPKNGYYAFVCEKCAPTFLYYGWFRTAAELEQAAEKIRKGYGRETEDRI